MPTIKTTKMCIKHGFYTTNKCEQCATQYNKQYERLQRDTTTLKIYKCKRWLDLRQKALVRDNFLCVHCLKNGIETMAKEVDHIIEVLDDVTLAYELNNLQSLCVPCHRKKTAIEQQKRG